MISSSNVVRVDFGRPSSDPGAVTTVTPKVSDEAPLTPNRARLDDIYDFSEPTSAFVSTARARFSTVAASLREARNGDTVDRDDAINLLKAELPRCFALNGWSDGALAIITALHHGLRNRKGQPLDDAQYFKVSGAVSELRDLPFLRFDRALDTVEALQSSGLDTDPIEAALLEPALHG